MGSSVQQLIAGKWSTSSSSTTTILLNPVTQESVGKLPFSTDPEISEAISAAATAYLSWSQVPLPERTRVMFEFQSRLKTEIKSLSSLLSEETGKTLTDAEGELWRGIEVVEHACSMPTLMQGESVQQVSRGIDTVSWIEPMGVFVGITPFNFPAMIPLWMYPIAITCGNTFVLKPSELVPRTPVRIAELLLDAGLPPGVLNIVHGGESQARALIHAPEVKGVSFVGSVAGAQSVYQETSKQLKRIQAFGGAKNHMVVMPDADGSSVVAALSGAACGAAGQRCMAISVALLVGDARHLQPKIVESFQDLQPGAPENNPAFGPLITAKAKQRVLTLIAQGKSEGATLLVDGSNCTVPGYEQGNFVGPTLFSDVTTAMTIYQQEIFGPVLLLIEVNTLEEALSIINENPNGNGCSIFTASGLHAREFQAKVKVGQVGINIPIPVPMPFFSFTGWRGSFYGDLHAYGKQAVRFYTETKTVTSRWSQSAAAANMTIKLG